MATQRSSKTGSLPWEDEVSPESRFRRVQQVTPRGSRTLPGMPMELDDADDDAPRSRRRIDEPKGRWWRPRSTFGRVLLATTAAAVLASLVTAYVMAARFLEHDSRFRIAGTADIQAAGLSEVARADILPVFGADIGKNIFFIRLSDRRRQLEQIPWIKHATVMRLLPDQIRVSVMERKPVAFVRVGQQIELVDANGVLLTMSPKAMAQHHYSFPVVTGIDPHDTAESRRARMAVYLRLIGDLDSTGQHLSQQISEVDLTDPEDARVLMPEQGADILAHFGDEQFLTRYQRYKAHIAEWRAQYPRLSSVDLRYDQQVVLQMAPDATGAQAQVNPDALKASAPESAAKPSPAVNAAPVAHHAAPARKAARPQHRPAAARKSKKHPDYRYAGLKHTRSAEHNQRQGQ